MKSIREVYSIFLKTYGSQGWWPLSKGSLETKHHNGSPESEEDQFEIIVGAILTQNTAWNNVEKAIYNLNKNNILKIKRLAETNKETIAQSIKPAGYFNQKAERIQGIAKYFLKNKSILKKRLKDLRPELLSLKGIGPETADSIILYAAQQPSFVIDAYTRRIFSRFLGKDLVDYGKWKALFENNLEKDVETYKEYHALIVEHAKRHCKTKPLCNACPLRKDCKFSGLQQKTS